MCPQAPQKSCDGNKRNNSENNVDLRVIGAGLPRTGTTSLKVALEILGFGPCHHMRELFEKPTRTVDFIRAHNGENVDFRELMKGYGSAVDTPTVDFYKEIHQVHPKAKIILTVRDSDDKWFESFQNTIGGLAASSFYYFCIYLLQSSRLRYTLCEKFFAQWKIKYGEIGPSLHAKHNQRVINENKEGEVLVFNVKEGWAPLCKFLGVNIPENIPFPNVNDTHEFKYRFKFEKAIGLSVWIAVGALFILSIYLTMLMR
jgi:hypothetical protein